MTHIRNGRRREASIRQRPICPKHGDTMSAGSSQAVTYYYCGVNGCAHSEKAKRFYNDVNGSNR
jgi:hypothetical protein